MTFTQRRNRILLYLAAAVATAAMVLAGVALFTVISQNRKNGTDLCGVLYNLVARSGATVGKPGTPGYAYYHAHPTELAKARAQNREFLQQLPCQPKGSR